MMNGYKTEYAQAYTEIECLLKYMPKEYIEKLPKKLIDLIHSQSNEMYNIPIDVNKSLTEQNFSKKTKDIIAVLKYNYWSTEEEKAKLRNIFNENEKKYQEMLFEKYNPDNLFKKKNNNEETVENEENNLQMIEYKESLFERIINKIKLLWAKIHR